MDADGHVWVCHGGYECIGVGWGHENKARTTTNVCGGEGTDTLRTIEDRAIQEHNASEKKTKRANPTQQTIS